MSHPRTIEESTKMRTQRYVIEIPDQGICKVFGLKGQAIAYAKACDCRAMVFDRAAKMVIFRNW